jgi:hypothetical protein
MRLDAFYLTVVLKYFGCAALGGTAVEYVVACTFCIKAVPSSVGYLY